MRRPTTYEQTLERLKTQGTREQECFSRAVTALRGKGTAEEFSATITDARAAIDKLVQDPELFTSRRAAVAGDAMVYKKLACSFLVSYRPLGR